MKDIERIIFEFLKRFKEKFSSNLQKFLREVGRELEKNTQFFRKEKLKLKFLKDLELQKKILPEALKELEKETGKNIELEITKAKERNKKRQAVIKDYVKNVLNFDDLVLPFLKRLRTLGGFLGISKKELPFSPIELKEFISLPRLEKASKKTFEGVKIRNIEVIDNVIRKIRELEKRGGLNKILFQRALDYFEKLRVKINNASNSLSKFNEVVQKYNKSITKEEVVKKFLSGLRNLKDLDQYIFSLDILGFKLVGLGFALKSIGQSFRSVFIGFVNTIRNFISETENLFLLERKLGVFLNSFSKSQNIFKYLVDFSIRSVYSIENLSEAFSQFKAIGIDSLEIFELTADTAVAFAKDITEIADDIARALEGDATAYKNLRHSIGLTNTKIKEFGGVLDSSGRLVLRNSEALERNKKALISFLRQYKGIGKEVVGTPAQIIKNFSDAVLIIKKKVLEAFIPLFKVINELSLALFKLSENPFFSAIMINLVRFLGITSVGFFALGTALNTVSNILFPVVLAFNTLLSTLGSLSLILVSFEKLPAVFKDVLKPFIFLVEGLLPKLGNILSKIFSFFKGILFFVGRFAGFISFVFVFLTLLEIYNKFVERNKKLVELNKERLDLENKLKKGLEEDFVYTDKITQKYDNLLETIEKFKFATKEEKIKIVLEIDKEKVRKDVVELLKEKEFYLPTEEITKKLSSSLVIPLTETLTLNTKFFNEKLKEGLQDLTKTFETFSLEKVVVKDIKNILSYFDEIEKRVNKEFDNLLKMVKNEKEFNKILEYRKEVLLSLNSLREQAITKYLREEKSRNEELLRFYREILSLEKGIRAKEIISKNLSEAFNEVKKLKAVRFNFYREIEKQERELINTVEKIEKMKTEKVKAEVYVRNLLRLQEINREIELRKKQMPPLLFSPEDKARRQEIEKKYSMLQKELELLEKQKRLITMDLQRAMKEGIIGVSDEDIKNLENRLEQINKVIENAYKEFEFIQSQAVKDYEEVVRSLVEEGLSLLEARKKAYEVIINKIFDIYKERPEFLKALRTQLFLVDINFFIEEIKKAKNILVEIGYLPLDLQSKILQYLNIMRQAGLDINKILLSLGLELKNGVSLVVKKLNTDYVLELIDNFQDLKDISRDFLNSFSITDIKDRFEVVKAFSEKIIQLFEAKEFKSLEGLKKDFDFVKNTIFGITVEFPRLYNLYEARLKRILELKKQELDIERKIREEVFERVKSLYERAFEKGLVLKLDKFIEPVFREEFGEFKKFLSERQKATSSIVLLEKIFDILENNLDSETVKNAIENLGKTFKDVFKTSLVDKLEELIKINDSIKDLLKTRRSEELKKDIEKKTLFPKPYLTSEDLEENFSSIKEEASKAVDIIQDMIDTLTSKKEELERAGFDRQALTIQSTIDKLTSFQKQVASSVPTFFPFKVDFTSILASAQREFENVLNAISKDLQDTFNSAVKNFFQSVETFRNSASIFSEAVINFQNSIKTQNNISPFIIPKRDGNIPIP